MRDISMKQYIFLVNSPVRDPIAGLIEIRVPAIFAISLALCGAVFSLKSRGIIRNNLRIFSVGTERLKSSVFIINPNHTPTWTGWSVDFSTLMVNPAFWGSCLTTRHARPVRVFSEDPKMPSSKYRTQRMPPLLHFFYQGSHNFCKGVTSRW